jgi:hypothetical protein
LNAKLALKWLFLEYAECFTIIMGSTFFLVGNDSEKLVYESAIFRGRNRKKKEEICCRKALANPPSFVSYNL